MKRKLVSVLLMLAMLISMMPSMAFASQIDQPSDFEGTVYVSYSHEGEFSQGNTDNGYMAYVPVDIAEVAKDASLAGDYPYDADEDGVDDVTLYMVFRYVLNEYGQGDQDIELSGSAGSTYFNHGLWHLEDGSPWDENLIYYYNGMFPLIRAGLGATSDQITVHDGDFVDVMHFEDGSFWSDECAGFQHFAGDDYLADYNAGKVKSATLDGPPGYVVHSFSGKVGTPVEAALVKSWGSIDIGAATEYAPFENTVYYGTDLYDAEGSWATDSEGLFEMTFDAAGDYWIWTEGTLSDYGKHVNAPAVAKVHIEAEQVQQNHAPTLAEGISASASENVVLGNAYELDLSGVFADEDGDSLTYKVSVNGAAEEAAGASYSFTPETAGTYTLVFKANDGEADSTDTYTVTLTVEEPPQGTDPTYYWDSAVDGNGWYAWSSGWNYVQKVFTEGVYVDSFAWDGNTCNIVLSKNTTVDASFHFKTNSYARQGGIKINGANAGTSSSDTIIELSDGNASVTVQPYASSRVGTVKTFVFTIKDGGVIPQYSIELPTGEGYTTAPEEGYTSPVDSKADFKFTVNILDGYKKGQNFKVKANGTELTADANGVYTIENIKADQVVTVEDVVTSDTVFYWDVTLPASPVGYSVTPVAGSESPVAEGGSYSFKVDILEGYAKNSEFAVKANGTLLTPDADGVYTIDNIQAHQTVTVEGVQDIYSVTLVNGTGYTVTAEEGSESPVFSGGSFSFKVNILNGYKKGADFTVKVNGTAATAGSGDVYTITNIRENKTVTVEDVVTEDTVNQYRVTLPETAGVIAEPAEGFSSPVAEGNDYRFKVSLAPGYLKNSDFAVKANGTALEADENGYYTIADIHDHQTVTVTGFTQGVSVTAPAGSTVTAGNLTGSFKYTWYDPAETVTLEDGRIVSYFRPISGTTYYRVQNPDGVTYWDYQSMTAGKAYEATASDIRIDDDSFNKDTIYHDFVYNYLDLADVYLNVNERNYLALEPGASREINAFRNWQAIESFTNSKIAIPDVHYDVIDANGEPSDLVTVTPDSYNTGIANITAGSGTGMAIIRVTYDAMIHKQGYKSGYGAGGADTTRFSAIWPECTGIIVVTVGEDGSSIDMGMTINVGRHAGKVAGDKIDAEHDLLFYYDDLGASYTFKPEAGTEVTVARSEVGEHTLSYSGFTSEGVTADEEGNVTVTGLTAGRNIVRVEKNGVANYQVISARKAILTAKDSEGNVVDLAEKEFEPGETLTLSLDNVNSPQEKLATCYNNSFSVAYFGEDAPTTKLSSTNAGSHGYGQYNFSSMTQVVTVKIPEDWDKDTYKVINGAIQMGGFSGCAAGGHRGKVNYRTATGMATGTAGAGVLSSLPDITIKVRQNTAPATYEVSLVPGTGYTLEAASGSVSPVNEGESYTVKLTILDGYRAGEGFAVKANDTVLTEDPEGSGLYTISNITGDQTVTVTGVVEVKPVIIAPAGSVITLGKGPGNTYFEYTWIEPVKTETLPDGRVRNTYDTVKDQYLFCRVQNPDGVTYWNYIGELKLGTEIEVSGEDIYLNDESFTKDTVYHHFEYSNLDLGDIYLNINEQGYLALEAGETKELDSFRNWYAINSYTNDKVALPDFHYEVMDINGNPSDLVTIVPDQHNSGLATLTAGQGSGLAVVRVTYDAMIYKQAYATSDQTGNWGEGGVDPTRFSHIWPETSGIFVVTVGEPDGSGIGMGMTINTDKVVQHVKKVAGDDIDAEHDILYYLGEDGASYTFAPEEGTAVSIARSTVTDSGLVYSGFTTEGVTVDAEGKVTITGLTDGRHIVKVEKNGAANYQIITARQIKLSITDAEGVEMDPDHEWRPGDQVNLVFTEVDSPQEKLSTYYNNNFATFYLTESGERVIDRSVTAPGVGRYDFSYQTHTVTFNIPWKWTEDTFSLTNGAILMRGMSGDVTGSHRTCSYLIGKPMAYGVSNMGLLGDLPDITLNVKPASAVEVDFTSQFAGGFLHAPQFDHEVLETLAESYGFTDTVDGVSALDVLVAAHELVYGEDFTAETAGDYLAVTGGNVKKQFAIDGDDYLGGFFLNHAFPNDGTELPSGGYNGTFVGNTEVKDGDLVEFFFYEDDYYGDTYNWFTDADEEYSRTYTLCPGQDLDLVLNGFFAMEAYRCKDEDELVNYSGADYVDAAQIYTVDTTTGALTEIEDAVTDEGDVTLTFDEPGTYYITAYGTDDCMFTQIMSLTKVEVKAEHALTKTDAKAATCIAEGNIEYWTCERCGKIFSDEAGANEIAKADTVIPVDPEAHVWNDGVVTTPASFEDDGVTTYTCTLCGHKKEEPIKKLGFTVTVNGVEITDIEIVNDGYDASYEDWMTGDKVESKIPLAIVTVPAGTKKAGITLNDHVAEYNTYLYTLEPGTSGYTEWLGDGFGDIEAFAGMTGPVAHAGREYEADVFDDKVYRIQTKYTDDFISYNLYAITFKYENEIVRIAGPNRYETSIAAAEHLKEAEGRETFDRIIVASGDDFPDALSASYLAYKKDAPILLVGKYQTSIGPVSEYINANLSDGGTVYIIGGTGAVSEKVDAAIEGKVVRLSGSNRYATNISVLKEAGVDDEALLVASGEDYADALSASAAGRPILLVGKALTQDQKDYLEENKAVFSDNAYVIGGTGAVSAKVEGEVAAYTGTPMRVSGSNRYGTSIAVANEFFKGDLDSIVIASGTDFPDGLSGGPIALIYEAPLVLVKNDYYNHAVEFFKGRDAYKLVVMGGKGVVSTKVAETIADPAKDVE